MGDCRLTGGGLLRGRGSQAVGRVFLKRVDVYEMKPLCSSDQIYKYIPGIDEIARVNAV